ncbi:MAG TPA: Gfo/Idh/MocA family oxidoreductase [Acidobacteriota bacterium]|jgi:predicted dehydrogenase|nr:Gfo/Idh/MocA family oxidoreductase [Acidobacteriota bacterium]HRR55446.1 Gfo/Idh/MocA family oxidoreductase [Acidobacteriota bacterium]HRV09010.1 Gfo/Idh/MocA family oxidoreductase [Acidobacteriota bacterium]
MNEKIKPNRRAFLKTTGVAASSLGLFSARSYGQVAGAGRRLRGALIGCGGIAQSHLRALLELTEQENIEIAAVCDVYQTRAKAFLDRIWSTGGRTQLAADYRAALEMPDVDWVTVATPEHWHGRITLDALDAGKHVYCEKPLTHALDEAKAVRDKIRGTNLKLQVGVQGMSDDSYATAYEAIRAGELGPVVEAQIDYVRRYPADRGPWRTGVDPNLPKPPDLDWKTWLGPAPDRPWSAPRYFEWRNYRDYSGGIATDLFIHRLTRIMKACGLTFPKRIVGMGGIYLWDDGRDLPDNFEMLAEYPAVEGITPGMTVHILGTMANDRGNDHLIRGHDATLEFTRTGWRIVAQQSNEVVKTHEKQGAESILLHYKNLFAAIRNGDALNCPVDLGVYGVAAVEGANQSWFQGKMLQWDPAGERWT